MNTTPNPAIPRPERPEPAQTPRDTPEPANVRPRPPRRRRTPAGRRRDTLGSTRRLASGRWQARYTDGDGVRRAAPVTFASQRDARDWLTTRRADQLRGQWRSPDLGAIPLAAYLRDYLLGRVDLAPRTRDSYQRAAAGWLCAPLTHPSGRTVNLGVLALRDISTATVREWHAAALAHGQERALERQATSDRRRAQRARHAARQWAIDHRIPVKATGQVPRRVLDAWRASGAPGAATLDLPPTEPDRDAGRTQVARAYAVLRLVLGTAHRDGLIPANPCTIKGAGAVRAPERPHATPAEVAQLAAHMPPRYAAAVIVAAYSGLRAGELFGLTRAHVDLERGTLRVERALVELPGQPLRFGPPKTAASLRTVHLPAPVVEVLAEHLATFTRGGPNALVFTTDRGKPVDGRTRSRHFHAARAALGLDRLHWHDLRHTGATLAAQSGASLRELQARLGHSTVRAAMTYQHATADRDRDLAHRMAQLLTPQDHMTPATPPPSSATWPAVRTQPSAPSLYAVR